jgi:hypothetical protein
MTRRLSEAAEKMLKGEVKASLPFDPFAIAQARNLPSASPRPPTS